MSFLRILLFLYHAKKIFLFNFIFQKNSGILFTDTNFPTKWKFIYRKASQNETLYCYIQNSSVIALFAIRNLESNRKSFSVCNQHTFFRSIPKANEMSNSAD